MNRIEREYEARKIALGHATALVTQLFARYDIDVVSTAKALLVFLLEDLPEEPTARPASQRIFRPDPNPAPTLDDEIPF